MLDKIRKMLGVKDLPEEVTPFYRGAKNEREALVLLKEARAVPPAVRISVATSSAGFNATSIHATVAPSDARRAAVARPNPEPAPVMIATRSVKRAMKSAAL